MQLQIINTNIGVSKYGDTGHAKLLVSLSDKDGAGQQRTRTESGQNEM